MEEIRVLLVDDNAELRRTLQEQLNKQEGLHVIGECANGLEALEVLGKSRVDVMVLDIIMPQMDGYALMEELRRQQPERMPRIIVATALGRDDFVMRAVELGAKYYMIKPFETQALVARIREVAGQTGGGEIIQLGALQHAQTLDEKLSSLFLTIGIPAHIKGYQFRHAIEVAWSRGRIETLNRAFGCKVASKDDKPTNGEFIAMIADKLAMEQRTA